MNQRNRALSCLLAILFTVLCCTACSSDDPQGPSASVDVEGQSSPSSALASIEPRQKETPPSAPAQQANGAGNQQEDIPSHYAVTAVDTPLFAKPAADSEQLSLLSAGEVISLTSETNPLWYAAATPEGSQGYVYSGDLLLKEGEILSGRSALEEGLSQRIASLREALPEGKYWNHMGSDLPFGEGDPWGVTDIPCEHSVYGETYCNFYDGATLDAFPQYGYLCQCLGFASFLSDQLFGKSAPLSLFYDCEELRIGDQIRFLEYEHSMVVIEKSDEYIVVAEVNADYEDCLISWSRQISLDELESYSWDAEFLTRYPDLRDEDGNLLTQAEQQAMETETGFAELYFTDEEEYYEDEGYDGG